MEPSLINSAHIQLYGYLDANSFQKLFPEEYIKKFASHLRVLQFEKKLFQTPPELGKLKFTKRSKSSQNIYPSLTQPKTHISKFTKINDTIIRDIAQIQRFKGIAKQINETLINHQIQSKLQKENKINAIKTIQNHQQVQMKVIDNMLVESSRETQQKINQKLAKLKNKQVFCNFTKRDPEKQGKNSYKSHLYWSELKKYNSEKKIPNLFEKKSKILKEQTQIFKSHSLNSKRNEKQSIKSNSHQKIFNISESKTLALNISTINRNRVKSSNRKLSFDKVINKRDLIQQTNKLKDKKNELKSILYSSQMGNKDWGSVVKNILNKNHLSYKNDLNSKINQN